MRALAQLERAVAFSRYLEDSNFGRADGWAIELNGHRVGGLFDPIWVEMFWDSYEVRPVPGCEAAVFHARNWRDNRFRFRSLGAGRIADGAFPGGDLPARRGDRVNMRRLSLGPTTRLERVTYRMARRLPRWLRIPRR